MQRPRLNTDNATRILHNPDFFSQVSPDYFSGKYWQNQNAITGQAQGRGTSYFFRYQDNEFVLRQYLRGGLIGKLIHKSYAFTGWQQTRSLAEFALLNWMHEQGLPVPRGAAAFARKITPVTYQAALISTRIKDAQDLVGVLANAALDAHTWQEIGRTIAQFHQLGVYHHDLNCHNILLGKNGKVWLIDFDRCERRDIDQSWQQANLDRLLRSFNKELGRLPAFHWQPNDWQALLAGYRS